MRKVLAVIRREFIERVRSKMFWVLAVLAPVFFAAMFFLPILLAGAGGTKRIAVVDATTTPFGSQVAVALDSTRAFEAQRVAPTPNVVDSLTGEVGSQRLDGFLLISDSVVETGAAEYRASNVSSIAATEELRSVLGRLAGDTRLEREGVSPAVVQRARLEIHLVTKKISGGKTTGESAAESFSLAYFMGTILYIAIALFGAGVMGSVLEEKTTRIVEVLVSSLTPFQLMLGKVIGAGAVSLLQFAIWGVSAKILNTVRAGFAAKMGVQPDASASFFQVPHVTLDTSAVFLAYFLGGFFLYAAMFAAIGAMSNNEQEARQAQAPVIVMLLVAFMSMFAMLNDPESSLARTLSLIPFTSPIAMPVRWAAGSVRPTALAGSLLLLVAGVVGVTWVAAKIYRVGILMTGKRPSLKELARWVRAA